MSKHYETRLQASMLEIRDRVAAVADAARGAVDEAMRGLIAGDRERMYGVILADHPINREIKAIDSLCHGFVAQHLPAAGHLRFVSSVLRLTIAIERIGDYAVTICRVGVQLTTPISADIAGDLQDLADRALRMLELASRAFHDSDPELADETRRKAKSIDAAHDRAFYKLVAEHDRTPKIDAFGLLTILAQLERVSDQAKNVCEEAIFVSTGRTKPPKIYAVLFVGPDGGLLAPLAAALAQKSFPDVGAYASAGLAPRDSFDPRLAATAARFALTVDSDAPSRFEPLAPSPPKYHVVVALGLDLDRLGRVPFNTIAQRWQVAPGTDDAALDAAVRELNAQIQQLMETLRGPASR